jgi:transcription-repair coupling factor (superfamily II helicase)
MSATPIPRTLNLALTSLRDMSVLGEPPAGRKPIETLVGEFDEEKIKMVIEKELSRGGQVYYVFNRVQRIASKSTEIQKLIPKAKVTFAHGQMGTQTKNLEKIMDDFYDKKYDVLVCTTIIGSGLDMPNVNTIIIENAQNFGLSELYQLRGRVGRSERKAYAYLFYPKNYVPEGESLERLAAIVESTELGSGFKIAKHDLEIRGAGNLLGTAQSGDIALIGFELYVQLLSQAIEKLKARQFN